MALDLAPLNLSGVEDKRPVIIAGPCSAETEEQVMDTATQLSKKASGSFVPVYGNHALNPEVLKA